MSATSIPTTPGASGATTTAPSSPAPDGDDDDNDNDDNDNDNDNDNDDDNDDGGATAATPPPPPQSPDGYDADDEYEHLAPMLFRAVETGSSARLGSVRASARRTRTTSACPRPDGAVAEQATCAVCLEEYDEVVVQGAVGLPPELRMLRCGHVYHTACMREVVARGDRPWRCPVCRAPVGRR